MRGLSDHCPLVLATDEEDWGPRPLRMLKCWKDVPGYHLFVREKWNSFQIDGWGGFVLKEKFRWIKTTLKDWHSSHTQNLPSRIESLKDRLAVFDEKGGEEALSESELAEFRGVSLDIHSLSRLNASICWQQSRSRWLKEGDANTKYFHSVLASRRRGNAISSLQVDAMVERNMFTGYSVGELAPVSVSHLQFADDTLLMGTKSWANVRALRAVLVLFESMSGLRVNFHKSMLVGVNILESRLVEAASALCCKVGKIPFLYLGLPIGGDPRRLCFWEPVLDRLKNRLSGWSSRFLSIGGRLVLIKSVLTSLPVYALSFFKAPSENKSASVAEMFSRGWEVGGEAWEWRRQLRAWEEELLGECQAFLLTISLQDHVSDRWQWRTDLDDGYMVRGAYQLLTSQDDVTLDVASGLIWHRQVPLKVSICAWRLLRDRLPTKANLVTRGILSTEAHLCVFGCGEVESAHHLFLYCSSLGSLWSLVSSWIGSSSVTAQTLPEQFVQFTDSAGGSRDRRSFMQLV
ncbi:unnamed protein product [Trifolium pratense]|uniref:Uncharacterized protein n=1 Tax=Trifolium pratense TaxID=57577 RepID=A0ACB0MCQ7_TRIPR|nr:unnamed protein product [Trifolium pratense]